MDKNAIKRFAVWARRELISRVSQKALQYGISDKEIVSADAGSIDGTVISDTEKKQRKALVEQINKKGYEQVMEEVAYTWFNRFIALRYMEVNSYLPSKVRVFTDENNAFKPQIIDEAIHMELEGLDIEKVYALKEANKVDDLYKYLLITQCNALNEVLPRMFPKIEDYTELLFPDNLLREGSVTHQMIALIPEEDWLDAVQIIGWLYQYYNTEKKDEVFAALKKNVKISKDNIPAATQLFTPDWIVRYMVENSLGRLWVEGHPDEEIKKNWKYYLEEAEQEPEVQTKLSEIRKEYANLKPEDIKCIDPCMGSGHILAYMFDVLVQIYEAYGYTTRDAVASIVENNIYGLDIDDRAAQLAYFAVMMKACQYDKRFLKRGIQPNVYAVRESNGINAYALEYFCNGDKKLTTDMNRLVSELRDAKEYGSILNVSMVDFDAIESRIREIEEDMHIYKFEAISEIVPLIRVAQTLAHKYTIVVTNPPYMGINSMGGSFYDYITEYFEAYKHDLYCVFIKRCSQMVAKNGYIAMITQQSFMFNSRYSNAREDIINNQECICLLHLGANAFEEIGGEVVQTASYVLSNRKYNYGGLYLDLQSGESQDAKEKLFLTQKGNKSSEIVYENIIDNFRRIDGYNFSYWLSEKTIELLQSKKISAYAEPRHGLVTGSGDTFMRFWFEVNKEMFSCNDICNDTSKRSKYKWFPYCKGGRMRRWYGNRDYVVNWDNDGFEIRNYRDDKGKIKSSNYNLEYNFRENLTWSDLSTGLFSTRYTPEGSLFDTSGPALFSNSAVNLKYLLAFMNTKVMQKFLNIFCTGLHYSSGAVGGIPYLVDENMCKEVEEICNQNVCAAKEDWDSFETSWDFKKHPLI